MVKVFIVGGKETSILIWFVDGLLKLTFVPPVKNNTSVPSFLVIVAWLEPNVVPVTKVSLSVIPVKPLPSPTKVPLNVPPLNVVAEIVPDVAISKVTALNTEAKSILSTEASKVEPSFCDIVNVLELKLKSFINVSVSPVML